MSYEKFNPINLFHLEEFKRAQIVILDKNYRETLDYLKKIYEILGIKYSLETIDINKKYLDINYINYIKNFFTDEFYMDYMDDTDIDNIKSNIECLCNYYDMHKKYKGPIKEELILPRSFLSDKKVLSTEPNKLTKKTDDKGVNKVKIEGILDIHNNSYSWINDNDTILETNDVYEYLANQWKEQKSITEDYKDVYIIFNISLHQTIVLVGYNKDIIYDICNKFQDIKYLYGYSSIGVNITNKIEDYFNLKEFNDYNEALTKIESFNELYQVCEDNIDTQSEKLMILGYIKNKYDILNEPSHKINAKKIEEDIQHELQLFVSNQDAFSKRISGYLLELDLNKKRFSDGIYYCGIKPKDIIPKDNLNNLFEERVKEYLN